MKKLLFALAAAITCSISAQENVLKNGGFEVISKRPKASDKYIMSNIKRGWDFGPGPVAKIPAHWVPSGISGKVKLEIVTIGEDGKNKEHVVEGKNSIHFKGASFHFYQSTYLKPGKYRFSLKYKGSGRISLCFYSYKVDAKTRRGIHLGSNAPMTMLAKPEWQTFTKEMEIGKWHAGTSECSFALTGKDADFYIDDVVITPVETK